MSVSETTDVSPALSWRNIVAATLGNALEFYDFMIYTFFAIQIGRSFFPAQSAYGSLMLSLATFGAGFVTRPIGGLVIGRYGDRVGRRSAMMLSYLMMGGATVALALIPSYRAIGLAAPVLAVLTRLVQGFSVGGAVGPNAAFLLEASPAARRGFAVSCQSASQFIASTFGGLVGVVLTSTLAADALESYGWRIAFGLGALTLPFGVWLQRGIPETLNREETALTMSPTAQTDIEAARRSLRVIVLGLVGQSAGPIVAYVFYYFATFAQTTLNISAHVSFLIMSLGNLSSAFMLLLGGWLSDRIGRRPVMIWSNLIHLVLAYPVWLWMVESRSVAAMLSTMAVGAIGMMPFGVFGAALTEGLPKRIRSSGFAIIYAVTVASFGGTCQLLVTWLVHATGNPNAPSWYLLIALVAGQAAFTLFPETAPIRQPGGDRRDRREATKGQVALESPSQTAG